MAFSSWRGVVGMINPTLRPGVTEEVIRLLPEGIGLIPLFLNIRRGTEDEFAGMKPAYDCLLYTSPSPRDLSTSRMPSSA